MIKIFMKPNRSIGQVWEWVGHYQFIIAKELKSAGSIYPSPRWEFIVINNSKYEDKTMSIGSLWFADLSFLNDDIFFIAEEIDQISTTRKTYNRLSF
jgi:hypothetical protein